MVESRFIIQRVAKHFAFWLFILAFQISRSGLNFPDINWMDFQKLFGEHVLMLPILIAVSYFFTYFLLPRFYATRKYITLIVFSVIGGISAIVLMRIILYHFVFPESYPDFLKKHQGFWNFNFAQYAFYIFSTVAMVVMLKYSSQLRHMEKIKSQLEKQNLSSELALLRNQVNPHFLFNTLNNINALVKKNPELTYQSILKLSDIMRYMLVEATNEKVLLTKEIEYLNSYIGLLSLRLENPDYIRFTVKGDPYNIHLPPMLLVPFVENAFKHGMKDAVSPGILIDLEVDGKRIQYRVENIIKNFNPSLPTDSSGIGISNLKRRLELLYPGRYALNIRDDGRTFKCDLELDIIS